MMGEYLINAQGEDVVAGIRTPEPISKMKEVLPEAYEQFMKNINLLERHFGDMQDVEFTIENGKLWVSLMHCCGSAASSLQFANISPWSPPRCCNVGPANALAQQHLRLLWTWSTKG